MVGRMLTERMNNPAAKKRNEGFQIVGVSSLTPATGPVARFPHGASRPQVLLHLPVSFLGGNSRLIQAHLADQFFRLLHAFGVAGISRESKPGMPALQCEGSGGDLAGAGPFDEAAIRSRVAQNSVSGNTQSAAACRTGPGCLPPSRSCIAQCLRFLAHAILCQPSACRLQG